MLKEISIQNFTLISEASISFAHGFTAITGETGAGKSVLLKALRIVCGEKTSSAVVRSGREKAIIEATFDISKNAKVQKILQELEIDFDEELVVQREINISGKSRSRVNGVLIPISNLQALGDELLQLHGQSEQLMLRDTKTHTQMLDAFCENELLLDSYTKAYREWLNVSKEIQEAKKQAERLAAEKDFIKFQYDELEEASLRLGEENELEEKTANAATGETERHFLEELSDLTDGENGLLDKLRMLEFKLRHISSKVPKYVSWHEQVIESSVPLENIIRELSRLAPETSISEAELNKINARLAKIQRLKRKYKTDEAGLIALCEKRKNELSSLENFDSDLAELEKKWNRAKLLVEQKAKELSEIRKSKALILDAAVESELKNLGMASAKFKTSFTETEPTPFGMDKIEFLLAPNTGEGERSLQKAVSGGELSRVLLAFKTVTANSDSTPLLIFDEVDSGISGEIGNKIGNALRKLGKNHQVLTITHLHQVACRANSQLAVKKHEENGRTFTEFLTLDKENRIFEIVRMLGETSSETAKEHAAQLLEAEYE
ncbi:MAG: DNA repair protein RecN [Fibrobacteraceae bacterium]|nr:DNA repair protein RecN [Fibrobacteraceae bacterium]